MGCMTSRPSNDADATPNQPNQPAGASSNRNNENVVVDRINEVLNGDRTVNGRPNKNLRAPSPVPKCPPQLALEPWTPRQLAREREAFFETRVTGDPQIWAALKIACEMLRNNNVAGAQGMLDSCNLTCPTGRIKYERPRVEEGQSRGHKGGVFDERGGRYDIPGWLVSDPEDLVPEPSNEDDTEAEDDAADNHGEKLGSLDGASDLSVEQPVEKGKGKQVIGTIVQVRARLSNGAQDVMVECGLKEKVKVLGQRIREKAGLDEDKKIKLVYLGRMMPEDKSLTDCAWKEGHVVNALVIG